MREVGMAWSCGRGGFGGARERRSPAGDIKTDIVLKIQSETITTARYRILINGTW